MTKLKLMLMAIMGSMILIACSSAPKNKSVAGAEGDVAKASANAVSYAHNTEASVLGWKGSKITGKTHNGNIDLSSGNFSVEDGKITGGKFEVDMTTITTTDFPPDHEMYGKLVGHLKSPDFFSVDSFPKASFAITKVVALEGSTLGTHSLSGNLTVKGISKELTFPATVKMTDGSIEANADFAFDRALYNVRYGSGSFFEDLGDNLINDEIELSLKLKATKPAM